MVGRAGGPEAWPGGEVVVSALTCRAGTLLHVRVQVSGTGTTRVTASVWADGTAEPTTPQLVRTDTTATLQAAGSVGLAAYASGTATAPDAVRVTALEGAPGRLSRPTSEGPVGPQRAAARDGLVRPGPGAPAARWGDRWPSVHHNG